VKQNNNNKTEKSIKRESDTRKFAEQDLSAGTQRRRRRCDMVIIRRRRPCNNVPIAPAKNAV